MCSSVCLCAFLFVLLALCSAYEGAAWGWLRLQSCLLRVPRSQVELGLQRVQQRQRQPHAHVQRVWHRLRARVAVCVFRFQSRVQPALRCV